MYKQGDHVNNLLKIGEVSKAFAAAGNNTDYMSRMSLSPILEIVEKTEKLNESQATHFLKNTLQQVITATSPITEHHIHLINHWNVKLSDRKLNKYEEVNIEYQAPE